MRRPTSKTSGRSPARTNAAGLVARRVPAAWVDSESGIAFTAVMPRVRDSLPLRKVGKKR